jgi:hypothetical protein
MLHSRSANGGARAALGPMPRSAAQDRPIHGPRSIPVQDALAPNTYRRVTSAGGDYPLLQLRTMIAAHLSRVLEEAMVGGESSIHRCDLRPMLSRCRYGVQEDRCVAGSSARHQARCGLQLDMINGWHIPPRDLHWYKFAQQGESMQGQE